MERADDAEALARATDEMDRTGIISTANSIADTGYSTGGKRVEDILDEAEQRIFNIADERPKDAGPVAVNPLLASAVDRIDELSAMDGGLTG